MDKSKKEEKLPERQRIAVVKSKSSRRTSYIVSRHTTMTLVRMMYGSIWECSCPAWTRKTPRVNCKHIDQVLALIGSSRSLAEAIRHDPGIELSPEGIEWLSDQIREVIERDKESSDAETV